MNSVNVNKATPQQLRVLLGLSADEAGQLIAARPFATAEALRKALPGRLADQSPGLNIPKLDINTQSADDLVKTTGIAPEIARKIVDNRPYYVMRQLQILIGADAYQKVELLYGTPDFQFVDKLTGQSVQLSADPSQLLVSNSKLDPTAPDPKIAGMEKLSVDTADARYHLFAAPESESSVDLVAKLQESYQKKVIPSFQDQKSNQRYFNPQYCVVQFKQEVPVDRQKSILSGVGVTVEEQHRTNGLYTLKIPEAATNPAAMTATIAALNAMPEVQFSEPNFFGFDDRETVATASQPPAQAVSVGLAIPWNLDLVSVPKVWDAVKGSPDVIVAIIDSGVDMQHPALKDSIVPRDPNESYNFADSSSADPTDTEGHGTFIAGILVANGQMQLQGICPACLILPLKVSLTGNVNSYARRRDAILFAVQKAAASGKRLIVNMSWKTAGDVGLIRDAVSYAAAHGAILVASAGNLPDHENEPHFPSDYPEVISVAAVGPDRMRTDYSYYGDAVDVSAPGGVESNAAEMILSAAIGGKTDTGCGTSFAAPHVAGIAALLSSANSAFTPAQIRFAIESGAVALTQPGMGKGLCNASASLSIAKGNPGSQTDKPPVVHVAPAPVVPPSAAALDGLTALNNLDVDTLAARFGLVLFTAKLLVAHRPYQSLDQVRGTLGLSDQQFLAFSKPPVANA